MVILKKKFRGIESWQRTLYIMFVAQFMAAVGFSTVFPFLPFYVEELGTNTKLSIEVLVGLVYTSQSLTMMISSPVWGMVADRLGRKLMVVRAMIGGGFVVFFMAFAQSAEHIVFLRTFQGFFTGTVAAANALVAGEAPRNKTGYSMGLLQVGFGAGLAIGPLIGGYVADGFGYNATFFVTSGLLLLAGVLVVFGVKEDRPLGGKFTFNHLGFISKWKNIFNSQGIPISFTLRFLSSLARMLIIPIIPLFIQSLDVDLNNINSFTGLMMGAASGATTLSAVYFGKLGDKTGHRKILIICSFSAGCLYFLQVLVRSGWQLMAFQVLVGVAFGGVIPTVSALLAGFSEHGDEGAVYGLDNSINAAGRAVAPMISAWIGTVFGYRAVFPSTGLVFLAAVLVAVLFLPSRNQERVDRKLDK